MGSIPGQGTKIMHMSHSVGKKKKSHCICIFMTIGRAKFFSYIH